MAKKLIDSSKGDVYVPLMQIGTNGTLAGKSITKIAANQGSNVYSRFYAISEGKLYGW
jgi:hypothetical protein